MQRKSPLRPADPGTPPLSQWDVRNFSTLHLDSEPCIIAEPRVEGRIRISFRLQPGLRLSSCVCARQTNTPQDQLFQSTKHVFTSVRGHKERLLSCTYRVLRQLF